MMTRLAKSQKRSSASVGLDLHSLLEEPMVLWSRAALLGCLSWLIPFAVSFVLFPLKKSNAPLFNTLMDLVVLGTGAALLNLYFRGRPVLVKEAVLVGTMWLALNLVFDYPMFAHG